MAGKQVRGLIAASKTQGWDPTVIEGFGSIENFDKDPGVPMGRPVGDLPGGTPSAWPDSWDNGHHICGPEPEEPLFNRPDVSREYGNEHSPNNLRESKFDVRGRATPVSIDKGVEDTRSIFEAPWNTVDFSRNKTAHKTSDANPYPGMPGARGRK